MVYVITNRAKDRYLAPKQPLLDRLLLGIPKLSWTDDLERAAKYLDLWEAHDDARLVGVDGIVREVVLKERT